MAEAEARLTAERLVKRWRGDPACFSREVLGCELWEKQAEVACAVLKHQRVAVRSGHKVGKSRCAAVIALWWCLTRDKARVVLTAPSGHQIRNILWTEVQDLYHHAKVPLGGYCSPDPSRGLQLPEGRQILCIATDEAEKLAGLSGSNQLFIVDEASGFPEVLWDPINGNRAGGGQILALSNPTQTSGTFYDAFHSKRHLWHGIRIASTESPNFVAGKVLVPGLAYREWVCEMLEEHAGIRLEPTVSAEEILAALESVGDASLFINVRIKGQFPSQSENSVIALRQVELARERFEFAPEHGRLNLGIDVARYGDDESVIAPRRGAKILPLIAMHGLDGPGLADRVIALLAQLRREGERPLLKVDVIGIGASCFDSLRQKADAFAFEVTPVNVAEASQIPEKYRNLRAQLHFATRTFLLEGGALPPDERLHSELVATRYSLDERGRYVVERKEEIKVRLRRSPDRADAVMLAIYEPRAASDEVTTFGGSFRSSRYAAPSNPVWGDDDDDDDWN